jgi:predicted DNA-binding transcriptional regulator AlpA
MPASNRHFLVDWSNLAPQIPYVRQHVLRKESKGEFPKRVQLGPNRVAWWQDEIDEWLASRPRGAPPQKPDLGPKRAAPEPDQDDMRRLHELLAEQHKLLVRLGLEDGPVQKPERTRRPRGGP